MEEITAGYSTSGVRSCSPSLVATPPPPLRVDGATELNDRRSTRLQQHLIENKTKAKKKKTNKKPKKLFV
jgi:hypothetical protein